MPNKAELECQVNSLKLQLPSTLAEARDTSNNDSTHQSAKLTDLQQHKYSLCTNQ